MSKDDSSPNWKKGDNIQVILDYRNEKETKMTALVNGKSFKNKWKFNFEVTEDLYFGCCIASHHTIQIINYKIGEKGIDEYLSKTYSSSVKVSQIE